MIHAEHCEIRSLLKGNAKLIVPNYQRNFDWGKDQAEELWNDLENNDEKLFLGTIVFDVSRKEKGDISIVDGQQRITTIILLLIACRTRAEQLKNKKLSDAISEKITFIDDTTGDTSGTRLTASPSIRDLFSHISKNEWDGNFPVRIETKQLKRQIRKVKPIYDFFLSKLKEKDKKEISELLEVLYGSFVVKIEIEKESEAFEIFERTNARGLELNAADLLKNYLFAANASNLIENLEDAWNDIIENSEGTVMRMLKYYWMSVGGYTRKSELYKKIKQRGSDVGVAELIKEIQDFSSFYKIFKSGSVMDLKEFFHNKNCKLLAGKEYNYDDIFSVIEALRLFRVTQIYPILYAALKTYWLNYREDKVATNELIKLFNTIEKYHFINNAICERVGNEIEKLYAEKAVGFGERKNFVENCKNLIKELKKRKASKDEFESRFSDIYYSRENISLISYIFDRFNNFERKGAQKVNIYFADKTVFKKSRNIEHFLSQSMRTEDEMEYIDNIGNLLVISLHTNSQMQDNEPLKKLTILKNKEYHNLQIVSDFIKNYEDEIIRNGWGKEQIEKRASDLADIAYNKIWQV